jgi:hypothetical protein
MFYVYEHIRLDTNQVFYVGKGKKTRMQSSSDRNKYWHNVVNKAGFKAVKIVEHSDEELVLLAEIERIDQCRKLGYKLCNITDGGQGISGLKHSEESKRKMSESRKDIVPHLHTEETKQRIREANTGVVFTEERKNKIRLKAVGRKMAAETKDKLRVIGKNFKHSEETLKRMSEIQRAMPKTKCPHCNFVGNAGNVSRWHLDRCKFKGE